MTPAQIDLVQTSFLMIAEIQEDIAALFYKNPFELNSDLRNFFKEDIAKQKRKLMNSIAFIVTGLDRFDSRQLSYIERLGEAHVGFDVSPEDFDTVGQALLSTLEAAFASDWTPDLADAWATVYKSLVSVMTDCCSLSEI